MIVRLLASFGVLLIAGMSANPARAHANGASYLHLSDMSGSLAVHWEIPASDLQLPLEIDADGDGELTQAELDDRSGALVRFATQRLAIRRGEVACALDNPDVSMTRRDEMMVALSLRGECAGSGPLSVSSQLYFGSPGYSTLLDVATAEERFQAALSMRSPRWQAPVRTSLLADAAHFIGEGVWHVLIGYDHVVFLLLLLLPAVLRESAAGWIAASSWREVLRDLLKVVTAFTVAHSITLALAATGVVQLPTQPIEIAIAASIVVAGVLNLKATFGRWRLWLAFAFGLVHGFGFANALSEIDIAGARLATLLAGFNVGVELAQVGILAAALPLLWRLSRRAVYPHRVMPALSLAAAFSGAVWFVQRL